jgi:hypothetical protein
MTRGFSRELVVLGKRHEDSPARSGYNSRLYIFEKRTLKFFFQKVTDIFVIYQWANVLQTVIFKLQGLTSRAVSFMRNCHMYTIDCKVKERHSTKFI